MLYFIKKYRALLFATALLFSGLVILTGTHENRRDLGILDKVALDVTGFFAGLITGLGHGVSGLWFDYVYLVGVRAENEALKADVDRMTLERAAFEEAVLETDRLRKLLGFRERTGFTAVPATVVGADVSGWFRTITIDRGSTDGIERGMAVVSPDGVVGRTHEVASYTAKVLLVTDSNSAVDAILQRTRGRGVVYGRVTPVLEMRYVHRTDEVSAGDLVLTSGVGGIFPKGLRIGVVSRVDDTATGLFKTVDVTPAADLARIEEVLVVTAHPARDYEALTAPRPEAVAQPAGLATEAAASPSALPGMSPSALPGAPSPLPARESVGGPPGSARPEAGATPRSTPAPRTTATPVPAATPRPVATPVPAATPRPVAPSAVPAVSPSALPAAPSPSPARVLPGAPPGSALPGMSPSALPGAPSPLPAREPVGGPPGSARPEAGARPSSTPPTPRVPLPSAAGSPSPVPGASPSALPVAPSPLPARESVGGPPSSGAGR